MSFYINLKSHLTSKVTLCNIIYDSGNDNTPGPTLVYSSHSQQSISGLCKVTYSNFLIHHSLAKPHFIIEDRMANSKILFSVIGEITIQSQQYFIYGSVSFIKCMSFDRDYLLDIYDNKINISHKFKALMQLRNANLIENDIIIFEYAEYTYRLGQFYNIKNEPVDIAEDAMIIVKRMQIVVQITIEKLSDS